MKQTSCLLGFITGLVAFFLLSCDRPSRTTIQIGTSAKILGHKGSGTFGEFGNSFPDNSIAGILHALEHFDGAEFDVQMSADSTLWLFHDHQIRLCDSSITNISSITDSLIISSSTCNYNNSLSPIIQLSEALKGFQEEKTLSFDLKVLQNPVAIDRMGGQGALLKFVLQTIETHFGSLHSLETLIEVPSVWYRELATSLIPYEVYVLYPTDEFHEGVTHLIPLSIGVHQVQQQEINQLETQSRPVQFWVVNTANEYMKIQSSQPRYIQTDNLPLFDWFQRNDWIVPIKRIDYQPLAYDTEFIDLFEAIQPEEPCMIQFENLPLENALLVVSIIDRHGNTIHWRGENLMELDGSYYYFTHEFPHEAKDTQIKVFIWRTS
jgi:hypothetical protein